MAECSDNSCNHQASQPRWQRTALAHKVNTARNKTRGRSVEVYPFPPQKMVFRTQPKSSRAVRGVGLGWNSIADGMGMGRGGMVGAIMVASCDTIPPSSIAFEAVSIRLTTHPQSLPHLNPICIFLRSLRYQHEMPTFLSFC